MIRCLSSIAIRHLRLTQQCAAHHAVGSSSTFDAKQQSRDFATRPFQIAGLDHLVLTVKDLDKTVEFYTKVLGMEATTFRGGRKALNFGEQKINLHEQGKEFDPKAVIPTPGSADLCFITMTGLDDVQKHLQKCNIPVIEGPVERTGAVGGIRSVYIRDPDGNLIEISNYIKKVMRP
ncbi:glyoxalase domain-containing protein 5 [Elysia marginata]|uniref:Glyoxalase domain-containing protein 5 n=1 Tax=Elysia marginata TaxID=1093978 RepID=A0AAV4JQH6_9GAST|nr:glyoxalase domain-containing protein 5 [Elysia marginata]